MSTEKRYSYIEQERRTALKFIVGDVVRDKHSTEVLELIKELDAGDHYSNTFGGLFCDRFDLGEWFVDNLVLSDIEVREELEEIYNAKITIERDSGIAMAEAIADSRTA